MYRRLTALAVVVVVAGLTPVLSAGPVGWWRFEGESGGLVGTAVNSASPGTHDGTGQNGAVYAASVPQPFIYDPLNNIARTNLTSLGVSGTARVLVPDHDDLDAPSFTIEAFFRIGADQTGYPNYVSHSGGSGTGRRGWQLDIDPQEDGRARFDTAADDNQTIGGGGAQHIGVGEWHHTAVTFDATTKRYTYYLDYGNANGKTLNGIASDATSVPYDLLFGSPNWPAGSYLDEVRYSNEVLAPSQFLRATKELIPEPATLSLVGLGLLAAAWRRRRR